MNEMVADIIIPVFNRIDLTRSCLDSIRDNSKIPYNLILIDNASDEETRKFLDLLSASNKNILLIRNSNNLGWVKAVNQGLRLSKSPYICIMNNDTIVRTPDWLSGLIKVAEMRPDIGLVNPYFKAKDKVHDGTSAFIEVDFCRGYCVLIKRSVLERVGLLDESYGLGYYDDDDYSVRAIRAGFRCVRANDVFVEHLCDSTFKDIFKDEKRRALHEKNKELFYSRWGKRLKVVFIITKDMDKQTLTEILLSAARHQHIVHLWNCLPTRLNIAHINIREHNFPHIFNSAVFSLALYLNMAKSEAKRYNLVFADNNRLASSLSRIRPSVYYIDMEKDAGKLNNIIDLTSKA